MVAEKTYVRVDEGGLMHAGRAGVSLESVVYLFKEGASPESIRRAYPALDLEEVYGAITFYLANQDRVEEYLRAQELRWRQARAAQDQSPPPVVQRLRALRAEKAREEGV